VSSSDGGTTLVEDGTSSSSEASGTTGDPDESFCGAMVNAEAIRCTDFDGMSAGVPWEQGPEVGYDRMVEEKPAAASPPSFLRVVRNDDVLGVNQPAQALLITDGVNLSDLPGLRLKFSVRFPPDLVGLCGDRPLRVFAVQYDAGRAEGLYSIIGSVSLDGLQLDAFTADGVLHLGSFPNVPSPTQNGWRPVEVDLRLGPNAAGEAVAVMGADGMMGGPVDIAGFGAPVAVDVNVGPFESGSLPAEGCSYDLDDVVLLPGGSAP